MLPRLALVPWKGTTLCRRRSSQPRTPSKRTAVTQLRYLGAGRREVIDADESGHVLVQLTSDLSIALFPLLAAMHLLEALLRLHGQRGRRP